MEVVNTTSMIHTHYEKQLITPLGYFKFFRPPHCLQQTNENETVVTIYSRNLPYKMFLRKYRLKNIVCTKGDIHVFPLGL
jgi:hypothetical protein